MSILIRVCLGLGGSAGADHFSPESQEAFFESVSEFQESKSDYENKCTTHVMLRI